MFGLEADAEGDVGAGDAVADQVWGVGRGGGGIVI